MEEAKLKIRTVCPYCKKMNEVGTIQCKCGFYFNRLYYEKVIKEKGPDALKEFINESAEDEAKRTKLLDKDGLATSIIFSIVGILAFLGGANIGWYFYIISAFSLMHVLNHFFHFLPKKD